MDAPSQEATEPEGQVGVTEPQAASAGVVDATMFDADDEELRLALQMSMQVGAGCCRL